VGFKTSKVILFAICRPKTFFLNLELFGKPISFLSSVFRETTCTRSVGCLLRHNGRVFVVCRSEDAAKAMVSKGGRLTGAKILNSFPVLVRLCIFYLLLNLRPLNEIWTLCQAFFNPLVIMFKFLYYG
jgi:hypothetical protein